MANIIIRENIAWIYLAKCYPKNLIQFPLSMYLYVGQTLYPNDRRQQHMIEDKNNQKFELLRFLTFVDDWDFIFLPILRKNGESFKNYMNRVALIEKRLIKEFKTNYFKYGNDSYGLNASDGGEHPANGGYRGHLPGETTGVKWLVVDNARKDYPRYQYKKGIFKNGKKITTKTFYQNENPFLIFLYMEAQKIENFIIDEVLFKQIVFKYWKHDIYSHNRKFDYLGIKNVSVSVRKTHKLGFVIRHQQQIEVGRMKEINRALFSNFLKLYQDGVFDKEDIINLDFFIWNAKLILECKFDIKNSRPLVFYYDFFEFRKIHHFDVDDLDAAIDFLKEIEYMTSISIPVGQQRLQCT